MGLAIEGGLGFAGIIHANNRAAFAKAPGLDGEPAVRGGLPMKRTIQGPAAPLVLALGLGAGAWLIPPVAMAQADEAEQERPVSYALDQAERGEESYNKYCEECHGGDLKGGLNGGAPLRGSVFEDKYLNGTPASWMFEFMSSAMPPNSPGRYSPSIYADLMAYILKRNGFQPGAPLPSDVETLENLIAEK